MHSHRFREWLDADNPLPAAAPALTTSGFVMCPMALMQPALAAWFCPWQVYQVAFEQAKASVQPRTGRPFNLVWN